MVELEGSLLGLAPAGQLTPHTRMWAGKERMCLLEFVILWVWLSSSWSLGNIPFLTEMSSELFPVGIAVVMVISVLMYHCRKFFEPIELSLHLIRTVLKGRVLTDHMDLAFAKILITYLHQALFFIINKVVSCDCQVISHPMTITNITLHRLLTNTFVLMS